MTPRHTRLAYLVPAALVAAVLGIGRSADPAGAPPPSAKAPPPKGPGAGNPPGCPEHEVPGLCKERMNDKAHRSGDQERLEHDYRAVARRQRYVVANGTVGAGGFQPFRQLPVPWVDPDHPAAETDPFGDPAAHRAADRPRVRPRHPTEPGLAALGGGPQFAAGRLAGLRPAYLADLSAFVADGAKAVALGKALFWDMQVGSDGRTACATCHHHAGVDVRLRHAYSATVASAFPGPNRSPAGVGPAVQGAQVLGSAGVVRKQFHGFRAAPAPKGRPVAGEPRDRVERVDESREVDAEYLRELRRENSVWADLLDRFKVNGHRVRQVTTRNSPTVIAAVGYDRGFHDGRAANEYNGFDFAGDANGLPGYFDAAGEFQPGTVGTGPNGEPIVLPEWDALPEGAQLFPRGVWKTIAREVHRVPVRIPNASLASQTVGPAISEVEMSWDGREFYHLGYKMRRVVPLAGQEVAKDDSVLGPYAAKAGLNTTYSRLIREAFRPEWWNNPGDQVLFTDTFPRPAAAGGPVTYEYRQIEANFALFFGLSVMLYQSTLVPDRSRFDAYARRLLYGSPADGGCPDDAKPAGGGEKGGGNAGDGTPGGRVPDPKPGNDPAMLTQAELRGFQVFRRAGCIDCHGLPEGSTATVSHLRGSLRDPEEENEGRDGADDELVEAMELRPLPEMEADIRAFVARFGRDFGEGRRQNLEAQLHIERFYDNGFYNLGVRPTREDVGNGGSFRPDVGPEDAVVGGPPAPRPPLNRRYLIKPFAPHARLIGSPPAEVPPGRRRKPAADPRQGDPKQADPKQQGPQQQAVPGAPAGAGGRNPPGAPPMSPRTSSVLQDVQRYKAAERRMDAGDGRPGGAADGRGQLAVSGSGAGRLIEFSLAKRTHPNWRTAANGAFKAPTLRNVELTGPYMHHGGLASLRDVVEFYNRGGDFDLRTNPHKHPEIAPLNLSVADVDALVAFLRTFTDPRVQTHCAPFDHPSLVLPHGFTVSAGGVPVEDSLVIPAVGRGGYPRTDPPAAVEAVLRWFAPFEDRVRPTHFRGGPGNRPQP